MRRIIVSATNKFVFFAVLIMLPCVVLSFIGINAAISDKEKREEKIRNELTGTADLIEKNILTIFSVLEKKLADFASKIQTIDESNLGDIVINLKTALEQSKEFVQPAMLFDKNYSSILPFSTKERGNLSQTYGAMFNLMDSEANHNEFNRAIERGKDIADSLIKKPWLLSLEEYQLIKTELKNRMISYSKNVLANQQVPGLSKILASLENDHNKFESYLKKQEVIMKMLEKHLTNGKFNSGTKYVILKHSPKNKLFLVNKIENNGRIVYLIAVEINTVRLNEEIKREIDNIINARDNKFAARIFDNDSSLITVSSVEWVHSDRSFSHDFSAVKNPMFFKLELSFVREKEFEQAIERSSQLFIGMIIGMIIIIAASLTFIFRLIKTELKFAQLKSDFVSNVSHELKTPLAAISLAAEKLDLGRIRNQEEAKEYYSMMVQESKRLRRLIENVLDFSRMSEGRKTFNIREENINLVVEEVVRTVKAHAQEQGFSLVLNAEKKLPLVKIDRDAISQALFNLLDNAMKYSQDKKEIEVTVKPIDNKVEILVRDHGMGITKENITKIFDKFYRVASSLTHDVKGAGLGLAIVKHIMDAHGGDIRVESELGKGSTFSLLIPT